MSGQKILRGLEEAIDDLALKPCPFCGGQPTWWNANGPLFCGCLASPEVHGPSRAAIIAIWNTRVDLPRPERRADAVTDRG